MPCSPSSRGEHWATRGLDHAGSHYRGALAPEPDDHDHTVKHITRRDLARAARFAFRSSGGTNRPVISRNPICRFAKVRSFREKSGIGMAAVPHPMGTYFRILRFVIAREETFDDPLRDLAMKSFWPELIVVILSLVIVLATTWVVQAG